jgi:hypothetical protein
MDSGKCGGAEIEIEAGFLVDMLRRQNISWSKCILVKISQKNRDKKN